MAKPACNYRLGDPPWLSNLSLDMMPVAGSLHRRPWSLSETMTGRNVFEICEIDGKVVRLLVLRLLVCHGRNHECAAIESKTFSIVDELQLMGKPLLASTVEYKWKVVTWLILPVVICLSQRLSHACLSINKFVLWNCEWLIKSVIVYLMLPCYMDNCGNSRANTCNQAPTSGRGVFIR